METIEQRGGDVLLRVRVQPRASRLKVSVEEGRVRVHVTAPPVEGMANKMVCEAVAKWLGVPRGAVSIQSGDASRDKTLLIKDLGVEDMVQRMGRPGSS